MLASVGWDPIQFIRQLFWLALEPPPAKYGLSIVPPLNEGGWYIISSVFLLASVLLWWARIYVRARALGLGTHIFWAFGAAIWLFLVLGLFRPLLMGNWAEAVPTASSRILTGPRRSRSATAISTTIRSIASRSSSFTARCCCSPCMARPSWPSPATAASANSSRSPIAAPRPNARRCSGDGPWASTPPWNHPPLGLVVCRPDADHRRHRHPADRHRCRQLVSVGHEARHRRAIARHVAGPSSIRP
jgi:hypothetical protein